MMRNRSEQIFTGKVVFDPTDRIYADHFPKNPIVPGTLIVKAFLEAIDQLDLEYKSSAVKNVRFLRFIPPGEYYFQIKRIKDRLDCQLFDSDVTVASGTVI